MRNYARFKNFWEMSLDEWADIEPFSFAEELKASARSMVQKAIITGKLVKQPCVICKETNVHAHHEDYTKPLEVTWLCPGHHSRIHRKGNPLAAARKRFQKKCYLQPGYKPVDKTWIKGV